MLRSLLIFLCIIVLMALGLGFIGDSGQASLTWIGYRIDTSATAAIIMIGLMSMVALVFWNIVHWMVLAPQRAKRREEENRRRQGEEVLTRGFMAVAAGEGAEARRLAVKALDLCDNIALVRILGAMAAEVSNDQTAAKSAYTSMLSVPELKMAGLKGLVSVAQAANDNEEAIRLATEAFGQPRPTMWAFKALFEARLESSQWAEAQTLVANALNRKLISPLYSERAKAALMTAQAAKSISAPDGVKSEPALDNVIRAAKSQPTFTPAAVLAAILLKKAGKIGRAEDVLEAAYQAAPHPALWITYRDLVSDETPKERAARLAGIADRNPNHRETRLLSLECAVIAGAKADIPNLIKLLEDDLSEDKLTRRLCGLMARAAMLMQNRDEAKSWVAKAALVKGDPEWADMDEAGHAFEYGDSDWAALVLHFAESGELTHPRYDRGEKTLPELPDLPSRFVPSMPFIRAAQKSSGYIPLPDDPGSLEAAIAGHDLDYDVQSPKPTRTRAKKVQK